MVFRDVFEYHRELTFKTYGLDPAHFIGLPQLTWNAGLKFTGVKLDDLTDVDMFMMFEKMKRGGVSVISHKYAKANNKYLPDYDATKDPFYLIQLDCNNLYGKSMSEQLPSGNFKWIESKVDEAFIMSYQSANNKKGYVIKVDLEYPHNLHDAHNDYPLAPEHLVINDMKKLAPNFHDPLVIWPFLRYNHHPLFRQELTRPTEATFDTGATGSIITNLDLLSDLVFIQSTSFRGLAGDMDVKEMGTLGGLGRVYYSPYAGMSIISASECANNGHSWEYKGDAFHLRTPTKTYIFHLRSGLYIGDITDNRAKGVRMHIHRVHSYNFRARGPLQRQRG